MNSRLLRQLLARGTIAFDYRHCCGAELTADGPMLSRWQGLIDSRAVFNTQADEGGVGSHASRAEGIGASNIYSNCLASAPQILRFANYACELTRSAH